MSRKKEYPVSGEPAWDPIHPGEILREDILPSLKLSVSEAARQLRITRQTLHKILACTAGVTPEMALRLGKFCGNGPNLWLSLQSAYDLWEAQRKLKGEIRWIPTHKDNPDDYRVTVR